MLYVAVRDNLATLLAEASELGRDLTRYVERDFARYLECGVLAHGFARVRCESCHTTLCGRQRLYSLHDRTWNTWVEVDVPFNGRGMANAVLVAP